MISYICKINQDIYNTKKNKEMKHVKIFETYVGDNGEWLSSPELPKKEESLKWWNSLDPEEQQDIVAKYLPDNDFGALAISGDDISLLHQLELKDISK
jgi:hypothetical protein